MTAVFRAPMRPGADAAVRAGVVGLPDDDPGERAQRRLARFADVPDGAFVWTRTSDGAYRVGRVRGPLREERVADGLVHVRPVDWLARAFGDDDVPAGVAATFARGGRNFQGLHDAAAVAATAALWPEDAA